MIRKLLLLALIAVAGDAAAEDANMCPRTRRDDRNHSGLRAIRRRSFWNRRAYRRASWRPWGKLNAIGSSLGLLARSLMRTGRCLLAKGRQYRSHL